ncbi:MULTISPECIES: MOSC domain-containing protein [Cryobacterium]|uniref:MOSC domain-containing protein n=1 Tax=Cryobacterium breve TaxID=1259258 RepID=A0ABY2IUR7_9MICO|nr:MULTISPECIES: MOSC domain-containing protein [Cryobacterium]TFC93589.1 MOSC domain-containing protein [Cryobacterium sp. TmT3-12]TFC95357.1 MOSC domain-containing protein [Cryobacterium breve]
MTQDSTPTVPGTATATVTATGTGTGTATVTATAPDTSTGTVESVSRDDRHRFSKATVPDIRLIAGFGVEGDAHAGPTTQHRYLVGKDPTRPNLTQVHLMPAELFDELSGAFEVAPGELGENVTTRGLDLVRLPLGARLRLGSAAVVEITGMRNPCSLINGYQKGLMKSLITTDASGQAIRRAGIMGIVIVGGTVAPGDAIRVELPAGEQRPLGVV